MNVVHGNHILIKNVIICLMCHFLHLVVILVIEHSFRVLKQKYHILKSDAKFLTSDRSMLLG
jgi:hypothetical protein